ncbi:hypothetical protein V8C86DRAFT_2993217 [Haematococcus lacustris]
MSGKLVRCCIPHYVLLLPSDALYLAEAQLLLCAWRLVPSSGSYSYAGSTLGCSLYGPSGTQASESTILQLNASLSLYTAGSIVNSQTLQNYKCCTTDNCNSGNPLVISSAVTMAANVVLGLVTCLASFILLSAI